MKKANLDDILVLVGGFIPKKDVGRLRELGIAQVFRPNSKIDEVVRLIRNEVSQTKGRRE
jgi:methylmalonyl-CoA mutase C-terminal domain/subunit